MGLSGYVQGPNEPAISGRKSLTPSNFKLTRYNELSSIGFDRSDSDL